MEKIIIQVNGQKLEIAKNCTVTNLIKILNITQQWLGILYNDKIIDKKDFNKIIIRENDKIEIIQPVGGG